MALWKRNDSRSKLPKGKRGPVASRVRLALLAIGVLFLWAIIAWDLFSPPSSFLLDNLDEKRQAWKLLISIWGAAISLTLLLIVILIERAVAFRLKADQVRLIKAPGTRLLTIVDFLFRSITVELTFKPLISDWQSEYFEALNQGCTIKARWISIRYRFAFSCTFIMAMGLSKVFSLFKQISK
jgi:hypothetical protein